MGRPVTNVHGSEHQSEACVASLRYHQFTRQTMRTPVRAGREHSMTVRNRSLLILGTLLLCGGSMSLVGAARHNQESWGRDPLALLPEGSEKRQFILDCTGCHRMDTDRAFVGGQGRSVAEWQTIVARMLGFAGATTGFPVISSGRSPEGTALWLHQHWATPTATPAYRATGPVRAGSAEARSYLLDRANDLPHDIAIDSAGRVVVTGMMSHQMLTLDTASGTWTSIAIPVPGSNPRALDVDAAGRWWVALGRPQMIARHDPRSGDWLVAPAGVYAHSVAIAPDGGAWLNGHFSKDPAVIARVDTARSAVETLALPNHPTLSTDPGGPIPYELRVAPNGVVWTSELQGNRLLGYDPVRRTSQVIEMPEADMGPRRFDIDSSGVLWVPAYAANQVLRVEPRSDGPARIERFPLPIPNLLPYVVRMDRGRGGLWIGTGAGDVVLHFAPTTRTFTTYALPDTGAIIRHLTVEPRSGDVWLAYGASPGIAARVVRLRPAR